MSFTRDFRLHLVVPRLLLACVCVSAVTTLSGCAGENELSSLKKELDEIRQRPRGAIQPPPEFTPQPIFTYAVHQLRSPFLPPSDEALAAESETKVLAPDMTRPREFLEQFNIEGLKLKGAIQRPGGAVAALIEDPDGGVHPIRVGNYVGKNYGRVASIEDGRVSVLEVVPDGHDGWVERPRTIRLDGE
jgi:type IV pilus assembly protein PilP